MTTKEFYDLAAKDEAIAAKIKDCKTPDAAYAAAKEAGLTDSMEEFVKVSEENNAKSKEMTPEEVESVAAAGDTYTTTITTVTPTAAASAGAAAV